MIEGKKVPEVIFRVRVPTENGSEWKNIHSSDIFNGKRVVVFALPGAFTPTCSSTHLPGYEEKYNELRNLGIEEVYCLSVNDGFVMKNWGEDQGIKNVKLLPDGNAEFTRKMGMLVRKENLGFGERSWRYSMIVKDGIVEKIFIEPGFADDHSEDPFKVSDVGTMMEWLGGSK